MSRKFYVPTAAQGDTLGFIRIQDILSNPTGAPITVNVGVQSDIGSQTTVRIYETSSGDVELTTADFWALIAMSRRVARPRSRISSTGSGAPSTSTHFDCGGLPLLGVADYRCLRARRRS